MYSWSSGKNCATGLWIVSSIPADDTDFSENENEVEFIREVIYLTDSELDSGVESE